MWFHCFSLTLSNDSQFTQNIALSFLYKKRINSSICLHQIASEQFYLRCLYFICLCVTELSIWQLDGFDVLRISYCCWCVLFVFVSLFWQTEEKQKWRRRRGAKIRQSNLTIEPGKPNLNLLTRFSIATFGGGKSKTFAESGHERRARWTTFWQFVVALL